MKHNFRTLMRRLSGAGFPKEVLRSAVLPDWWDDSCADESALLTEVEVRAARFLGQPITQVRDPEVRLAPPSYSGAQLRRVRNVERDRLAPAIHTALQVAEAVHRTLGASLPPASLPADAADWRGELADPGKPVVLEALVADLWRRGIPVLPLEAVPSPTFQGLSCIVEDRPVIILGHKHDEPGRIAFVIAHEAAHIARGHCRPGQPVVDEEDAIADDSTIEVEADAFATNVLIGDSEVPRLAGSDYKELANQAWEVEGQTGADASIILFSWARYTGDYAAATMAVQALYRGAGARQTLAHHVLRNLDLAGASETDRGLLQCVSGLAGLHEVAD